MCSKSYTRKNIFPCQLSVHNTINLSCIISSCIINYIISISLLVVKLMLILTESTMWLLIALALRKHCWVCCSIIIISMQRLFRTLRSSRPEVLLGKGVLKIYSKFTAEQNTHTKCDFNKVANQLFWNCTPAWVFSLKFAAYFQSTFSYKHLWMAALQIVNYFCKKAKMFGIFLNTPPRSKYIALNTAEYDNLIYPTNYLCQWIISLI